MRRALAAALLGISLWIGSLAWTGFLLTPHTIEFWQDRDFRLHDRRQFTREGLREAWSNTLLYP